MIRKKYILFILFGILWSCSPDNWKTSTDSQLFNYRWVSYYADLQGRYLDHYLKFETWGEGRETIMNGSEELESNFFIWYRENDGISMRFEYENGQVKYFDRIQMLNSRLYGKLDGIDMVFDPL